MRLRLAKGKVFLRYLFLYMGVFLFMVLVLVIFYRYMYHFTRDFLFNNYALRLNQCVYSIERLVGQGQNLAYLLADQNAVLGLSSPRISRKRANVVLLLEADAITRKNHTLLGDEVVSSFILYPGNEYLVSNFIVSDDYHKDYGQLFGFAGLDADAWHERLTFSASRPTFLSRQRLYSYYLPNKEGEDVIPVVFPIESDAGRRIANLVLCVRAEWVVSLLMDAAMTDAGCSFCLENQAGEAILGARRSASGRLFAFESRALPAGGLTLTLFVPKSLVESEISNLLKIIKLVTYAGIAGSMLLVLFYALYHSLWLQRIIRVASPPEDAPMRRSPYLYIEDLLKTLNRTQDTLRQKLYILENTYTENLFTNVCIRGLCSKSELNESQRILSGYGGAFCVVVMRVNRPFWSSALLLAAEDDFMHRAAHAILLHYRPEESVIIVPLPAFVIAGGAQVEYLKGCLSAFAAYGAIGASDSCADSGKLNQAYQQAYGRISPLLNDMGIGFADRSDAKGASLLSLEKLTQMQEWIQTGNVADVGQYFDALADEFYRYVGISQLQLLFVLRQILIRIHQETSGGESADEVCVLADETTREGLMKMKDFAVRLARARTNSGAYANTLIKTVYTLIENEFLNPALSTGAIAERLHYSEKHIYRIVKEFTGKTVGDLIEEMRLKFAVEMLLNSGKKNEEIALLCGFGTPTTFYRAFKRAYGSAPGEWRKKRGLKEEA